MPAHLENSAGATGLEKVSFHSNPKERQCKRMFKLLHNCTHLTCQQSNPQNSPSKASIVHELRTSRCTAGFRKGTGARDQIVNICWIIEKAREKKKKEKKKKQESSRKTSTSASLTTLKLLTVWITTNCGKFFKRWEYQATLPAS